MKRRRKLSPEDREVVDGAVAKLADRDAKTPGYLPSSDWDERLAEERKAGAAAAKLAEERVAAKKRAALQHGGRPKEAARGALLDRAAELVAACDYKNRSQALRFLIRHHFSGLAAPEARERTLRGVALTADEKKELRATEKYGQRRTKRGWPRG